MDVMLVIMFSQKADVGLTSQIVIRSPSHRHPGFDFLPSQLRRKLSLSGGSAAKVFEPRSQNKSIQQKRGEFFAAHPAGLVFWGLGGAGGAFFWFFLVNRP